MMLPGFVCDAMWRTLAIHATVDPHFVIGGPDAPYLRRWHITPRGAGPAVYLHQFLRSDDDRALHDHPYESTSILMTGSYREHLPEGAVLRPRGSVVQRDAMTPHRVELLRNDAGAEIPVWTLFLTGPRVRDWGFHCPKGWVPWQDFVDARDSGAIGRGCE